MPTNLSGDISLIAGNPNGSIVPINKDPIFVSQWQGPVYESFKDAPFDKDQPIPYIIDLSIDGLLKIGWNKKMKKINELGFLTENVIAVRSWQEETIYERRKL